MSATALKRFSVQVVSQCTLRRTNIASTTISPLIAFGHHRVPGYLERLNPRLETVERGKEALRNQVKEVEWCMEEFTESINTVIATIWEYAQTTMWDVYQAKIDLEQQVNSAIEEVERTIY